MNDTSRFIAIIGGGPAGLMAAHKLLEMGYRVHLYDAKPSVARKFQLAGRGGLNLTHSEPLDVFATRYYENEARFTTLLKKFTPNDLRDFCHVLGQDTFIGSSGRVFPTKFKATELLRAWLSDLSIKGLKLFTRHKWIGFDQQKNLLIEDAENQIITISPQATLLALGGASWGKLGSDAAWVPTLTKEEVNIEPLEAANCGYETRWPQSVPESCFGSPLKNITLTHADKTTKGEIMLSSYGLEGGAVYALSKSIREAINKDLSTTVLIDLKPKHSKERLTKILEEREKHLPLGKFLKQELRLSSFSLSLLKALTSKEEFNCPKALSEKIKSLPVNLYKARPIDRAISTAGGIKFDACTDDLMLKRLPGIFVAGEMLDWEAPTGGYLLQGCFSMAVHVAQGVDHYLREQSQEI
ncbi:TIGR03862 family flavoprotein [Kiloniella sp. EL199]|uniref:TIGR03862 family flavoprotein n=1 Tax=Kiloniella sp. EL199 TaxID=2107581 RepID=UPI001C1FBBE5|nr:TIGR03862 family flavoprotein [Kiloniella sp. EL199]